MLIRKNTKAFKTILEIVSACQGRADREQLIRLFITKAGSSVNDRISVDSIQGDAALFYEMNYQTVLNSLRSPNHQLNESDEFPGVYYFHSTSNKSWDETPFEFDEAVKKEFSALPDLPIVRRKEKYEKFVLPTAPAKRNASVKTVEKKSTVKGKKVVAEGPRQPNFKLKHKIDFTYLDKIIFRQPLLNKEQILTYYDKIAEHLLPYVKDRSQEVRTTADSARPLSVLTTDSLFAGDEDNIPEWLSTTEREEPWIFHDKEHLLLAVERGVLEFHPVHARKNTKHPDYIMITVDSPDSNIAKAVQVAQQTKIILDGLRLPSFVKTNGSSQLDLYLPLDAKGSFEESSDCAMYLCKLVSLKIPNLVAVLGAGENDYGKVSLDYSLNGAGQTVVAPYSLVAGESVTVATPLLWDEVNENLNPSSFTIESIFQRLKHKGDAFENLNKKKINASELLDRLDANYSFLV